MSTRLGEMLYQARKAKGLTFRKAGEESGLTFMYISQIEAGLRKPSDKILEKLASFYEIPIENLKEARAVSEVPDSVDEERVCAARTIYKLNDSDFIEVSDFIKKLRAKYGN